jgi:hypothetical protein
MGHDRTAPRQGTPPGLRPLHFQLYRLMLATSMPGQGGRPVCSYGQTKLAARLGMSVSTVGRLIADMREPGTDVRHPKAAPRGRRLGWLLELPREVPGGRGGTLYGGNRYVLQLDPDQLDQLEALHLFSGHTPSSDRSVTPEGPVSPAQIEASSDPVTLRRYVRSNPTTGSAFTHPESEPAAAEGQQPTGTNERALAWEPPGSWSEEHRAAMVNQALARIRAGLDVRTGQPDGLDPATRERRARGYLARVVGEDLTAERARLQSGETPPGYPGFVPKWAEGGPPGGHPDQGAAS